MAEAFYHELFMELESNEMYKENGSAAFEGI